MFIDPGPSRRGWHRIGKAMACVRQYGFSVLDKMAGGSGGPDTSESEALIYGKAWHLIMAHHYALMGLSQRGRVRAGEQTFTAGDQNKCSDENTIAEMAEVFGRVEVLWGPEIAGNLRIVYNAHIGRFASEVRDWEIQGVEVELEATLPDCGGKLNDARRLYTQRADLVVLRSGKIWIVDHKTVYRIEAKTSDQFLMDGQFIGYAAIGAAKWGEKFGGVILNRAVVRGRDSGVFARTEIAASPAAIASHLSNVAEVELDILGQEERHGWNVGAWRGSTSEHVCYGKYGPCAYIGRCRFGSGF